MSLSLVTALACSVGLSAAASEVGPEDCDREKYSRMVLSFADIVLEQHVSPPPRAVMVEAGVRRVGELASLDVSAPLLSLSEQGDCEVALAELWEIAGAQLEPVAILNETVRGLLTCVPGFTATLPPDAANLQAALDGNRYVGIGIYLRTVEGRPQIYRTFFHGPARRAGIVPMDVVFEIDGVDTLEMEMARFIESSRGEEGTEVTMVVAQPGGPKREYTMTRTEAAEETVYGIQRAADEGWDYVVPGSRVAHLRVENVNAGTAHELKVAAERLRAQGGSAVVLDLRACRAHLPHYAVMCADLFLPGGPIGEILTAKGTRTYEAEAEAPFRGLPVAVLVDEQTAMAAEWLAAILQARGRAEVFGVPTVGNPQVRSTVAVPGWNTLLTLQTGTLLEPMADTEGKPVALAAVQPDHLVEGDALAAAVAGFAKTPRRRGL